MARAKRRRLRPLAAEVAAQFPEIANPPEAIRRGRLVVDGRVARNPRTLVRVGSPIALNVPRQLRGSAKLVAALAAFQVPVDGRIALDLGASAGGFTSVLLDAGAIRVYAVDAGYGQLAGRLRQDPRVVNHERTNVAALDPRLVPDRIGIVTVDLSYLSIARLAPQLGSLRLAPDADLMALVKPMYELGLATPPDDPALRREAVACAGRALAATGWRVAGSIQSPVRGARGAIEHLLHARRTGG
jgi:23S rRNA (cytidine1920-2'-O)/16S rRNA (cytidine1409-2'-O)-methyltransferase